MIVLRVVLFAVGLGIVVRTILSALLTFVLPRAVTDRITRFVFIRMRSVFTLLSMNRRSYLERDALWALFAPISLLALTVVWVLLVIGGFTLMFWAVGVDGWQAAFTLSGSSLLTLGFAPPANLRQTILAFAEAGIGLGLVAVLISFLPTIYGAWSRREGLVTTLETRAGSPPVPAELFVRFHRLQRMDRLNDLWTQWEVWFADVEESHTSLASLALFRSSHPERSWVVSAGCVLDSAALALSTMVIPGDPQAAIVIRAGTLAFRRLCTLFRLPYPPDPHYPDDPIGVTRAEFDALCSRLEEAGVRLVEDREAAWLAFAGWRVNYDVVLRSLAGLTLAPPVPWSGDRAIRYPFSRF